MNAAIVVLAVALTLALAGVVALLLERAKARAALEHARSDRAELASRAETAAARTEDLEGRLGQSHAALAAANARLDEQQERGRQAQAELEKRLSEQQQGFRDAIRTSAQDAFRLASEQLKAASDQSLDKRHALARAEIEGRLQPIDAALKATQAKLGEIELARAGAYAGLTEQIASISRLNTDLKRETSNLYRALSKPQVRGRYGEIQLERVADLAGMRAYCDFSTQESARDEEGRLTRPDMIVRLPNERCVAVDAKTNIDAYIEAVNAHDPAEIDRCLDRFAGHVAEQAAALSRKEYWSRFEASPEFVVMFIPGDQFIDAALQRRPELIELAAQHRVILASPSTLIGLLRAVYVGWREKQIGDQAQELFALGRELHKRAAVAFEHADALGDALRRATDKFNSFAGSIERQLVPTLRKFEEAGASSDKTLPDLHVIETTVRSIRALPGPARSADASTSHAPTGP